MKKFLTSRKFVVAAAYGLLIVAKMLFDLKISDESLLYAAGVAATYIGAEAVIDAKNKPAN